MRIVEFAFIIGSINYTRHGLPYSGVIKKMNKEKWRRIHQQKYMSINLEIKTSFFFFCNKGSY